MNFASGGCSPRAFLSADIVTERFASSTTVSGHSRAINSSLVTSSPWRSSNASSSP